MQRSERSRQITVNAGHKRQTGDGGEIRARGADVTKRNQKRSDRKKKGQADSIGSLGDRLYQALQTADFRGRQRQQHTDGSDDVTECYGESTKEQGQRNGAARVLDFFRHERRGFASAESESQYRPEDDVVQAHAGRHGVNRERRCRSKAVIGEQAHANNNQNRNPHGKRADVMQPFADVESDDVQQRAAHKQFWVEPWRRCHDK